MSFLKKLCSKVFVDSVCRIRKSCCDGDWLLNRVSDSKEPDCPRYYADYLIKRGIKGFSVKEIGGNDEATTELSAEETYALYSDRLEDILAGIAFTPIGYPANFIMNSRFGYRSDPIRRGRVEFHPGIDFKGSRGDAVKSTADGQVIIAGWFQGYGKCVKIRHKNNLETLYGHLSKVNVKAGQMVNTGQVIGQVGSTGHSTGNHLHYEVRKNGKPAAKA